MRQIAANLAFNGTEWVKMPLVSLDDTGKIVKVDRFCPDKAEPANTEFYNGILTPGFINAHTHLDLSMKNAVYNGRSGMSDFVKHVRLCRESLKSPDETYLKIQIRKINASGTVALVDVTNSGAVLNNLKHAGLKNICFFEYMMLNASKIQKQTALFCELLKRFPGEKIYPALHSPYTMSTANFQALQEIFARPREISSIHFRESKGEDQLYQHTGQLYELYRDLDDHYKPAVNQNNLISKIFDLFEQTKKILFVHNTFTSRQDIEEIENLTHETNKKTGFVLCPRSNNNISGVHPPYDLFRHSGLPVMLGTDSLLSASSLSIFDELLFVHKSRPDIPTGELLQWITGNPAKMLGMEQDIGSLEPGKTPGINLIHGAGVQADQLPENTELKVLV
ncbi:MAG: amidohydrolase family protein [Bacteroidota bacterium]